MKKIFYISFGVIALIACTKEADVATSVKVDEAGAYSFEVYLEDVTKATINSSTGEFSWTGDEEIAVWDSNNKEFVTFNIDPTNYSNEGHKRARFTASSAKADASFVGNVAYYPASIATRKGSEPDYTPSYTFPTSFSSLEAAAKGFPMSGTVTVNEIKLSHLGSMINLTLNNVPSFTTTLILNAGAKEITIPVTPSTGVLNAVVPIPADEYVLTVKLKDDNNNIFYTKPRTSKMYTARNYYTTNPITLNHYIEITNSADPNHKLAVQTRGWNAGAKDYTDYVENWSKHTLFVRADGTTKYILLSETDSNFSEGKPLRIQLYSGDTEKWATECVFNYRNISFDVTDNSLKTEYRVYPKKVDNKVSANHKLYIYLAKVFFYVTDNSGWSDLKLHYWGQDGQATTWPGNAGTDAWSYKKFEIPLVYAGKTVNYVLNDGASNKTGDISCDLEANVKGVYMTLNSDKSVSEDSKSYFMTSSELSTWNSWPGISITPDAGGEISSSCYIEFSRDKFEDWFGIIISDNGDDTNRVEETHGIYRDYVGRY